MRARLLPLLAACCQNAMLAPDCRPAFYLPHAVPAAHRGCNEQAAYCLLLALLSAACWLATYSQSWLLPCAYDVQAWRIGDVNSVHG